MKNNLGKKDDHEQRNQSTTKSSFEESSQKKSRDTYMSYVFLFLPVTSMKE